MWRVRMSVPALTAGPRGAVVQRASPTAGRQIIPKEVRQIIPKGTAPLPSCLACAIAE